MLDSGCVYSPVKRASMNTTFWPKKTTYILNNPQRQKGHTKRNNAYCNLLPEQEKKDLRFTSCNWKVSPSVASVSSLCTKSFGAGSEQRMRNKKNVVSKRVGRGWPARKSGPLGSVGGGGGGGAPPTRAPINPPPPPPSLQACSYHTPPWQPALVGDHLP